MRRTHPLRIGEIESAMKPVEEEFEKDWKDGKVDGWQKQTNGVQQKTNGAADEGIWCAACAYPLHWSLIRSAC